MRSLNTTTRCHSVRSRRSPLLLSRQLSEVASDRLATHVPSWVERISGSRPRLPTRMTLLTLPAIASLPFLEPAIAPLASLAGERKGNATLRPPATFCHDACLDCTIGRIRLSKNTPDQRLPAMHL